MCTISLEMLSWISLTHLMLPFAAACALQNGPLFFLFADKEKDKGNFVQFVFCHIDNSFSNATEDSPGILIRYVTKLTKPSKMKTRKRKLRKGIWEEVEKDLVEGKTV